MLKYLSNQSINEMNAFSRKEIGIFADESSHSSSRFMMLSAKKIANI